MARERNNGNQPNEDIPHLIPENREERAERVGQDDFDAPNPNLRQAPPQREIIARQQQNNQRNGNAQSFTDRVTRESQENRDRRTR